jgi:hypothetical protein
MSGILPAQVRIIHVLKSKLRMEESDYRQMLAGYGVTTSKDLTRLQAADLTMKLQAATNPKPTRETSSPSIYIRKYDELGHRPGMGSPPQLRKIEAMWADVSRQPDAASRATALRRFLKIICGVEEITWLETTPVNHVSKVLRALESMKRNKERKEHEQPGAN